MLPTAYHATSFAFDIAVGSLSLLALQAATSAEAFTKGGCLLPARRAGEGSEQ